jgi:hypothetical protein
MPPFEKIRFPGKFSATGLPKKGSMGRGTKMRHIHLDDGFRLRFPGRSEDFDQGVEIGMLAILMDYKTPSFRRWISKGNVGQVKALAKQLGYYVVEGGEEEEWVELVFRNSPARPELRLVHSVA